MENELKYKKIFFKFIYWYLQLEKVENYFKEKGIIELNNNEGEYLKESKYFSLLNEVDLSKLTNEEKRYLEQIDIENIDIQKIYSFMFSTYERVLLRGKQSEFIYYGPISERYKAPSDCVALGFYYDKYGLACGNRIKYDEIIGNEKIIYNMIDYMQFGTNSKIKVAFVMYNELYNKVPARFIK